MMLGARLPSVAMRFAPTPGSMPASLCCRLMRLSLPSRRWRFKTSNPAGLCLTKTGCYWTGWHVIRYLYLRYRNEEWCGIEGALPMLTSLSWSGGLSIEGRFRAGSESTLAGLRPDACNSCQPMPRSLPTPTKQRNEPGLVAHL